MINSLFNNAIDCPYERYEDYLEALFALMDLFLWYRTGSKESFLKQRLLQRGISLEQDMEALQKITEERRDFSIEIGRSLALEDVLAAVGGDSFVRQVLVLSMLMVFHKAYKNVIEAVDPMSEGKLTLELCVKLFFHSYDLGEMGIYEAAQHYEAKMKQLFPALETASDAMYEPLICDMRLMDILAGRERCLPVYVTVSDCSEKVAPPLFRENQCELLESIAKRENVPVIWLHGAKGSGKHHMLRYVMSKAGKNIVFFDVSGAYSTNQGIENIKAGLLFAVRECVVFKEVLAVTHFEVMEKSHKEALVSWLDGTVHEYVREIFIFDESESQDEHICGTFAVEAGDFNEAQRIELWRVFLEGHVLSEDFSTEAVGNTFNMTPGQMIDAIQQAELVDCDVLTEKNLYEVCYMQLDHGLKDKATRVQPYFGWDDIKLAPEDKEILSDICHCVKVRHRVLSEWNFKKVLPYGGGITVLFSGPPGTGKTMAAQVIAKELHMELYKIDLSQVIDKYVGETEKNIKNIFEQAKKSNSILFFDEADSIFNKRLEASGANERFANIESSLLLQCIEEYNGITILATNNFSSMDSAFIRRFKYYILFKEPDEQMRYEIWKSVIPKQAPLSDEIDLHELAHTFEFTGAVIKNVVLAAAYLAAASQREIRLVDILKAIRREMTKNNLVLTREKMGSLGYMFDEMMESAHAL